MAVSGNERCKEDVLPHCHMAAITLRLDYRRHRSKMRWSGDGVAEILALGWDGSCGDAGRTWVNNLQLDGSFQWMYTFTMELLGLISITPADDGSALFKYNS